MTNSHIDQLIIKYQKSNDDYLKHLGELEVDSARWRYTLDMSTRSIGAVQALQELKSIIEMDV